MNASRRYLPLSLMLLLAASVGSANAGSYLDPYSHIKAPAGNAPKKKFLQQEKESNVIPQADEANAGKTYVMAPLGEVAEDGAKKDNGGGGGFFGKTIGGIKGVGSGVAKSGSILAKGAKASGGMAKKSGTMIGLKDKNKDSKEEPRTQIASKPNKVEEVKTDKKKQSPSRVASVDDWYTREAEKAISHKDDGTLARKLVKQDPSNAAGKQTAFLERKGGNKVKISSKLNPFNKFSKKGKDKDPSSQIDIRPASGFADGAANPDEEVLAELEREKKAKQAARELKEGSSEPFTPIVNTPESAKKEQLASKNGKTESPKKKSKFGLNVNIAKLKPGMPSMPSFGKGKKKQESTAVAAAPKKEIKKSELDKLTEVEPIAKIDPAGEDDIAPASDTTAFTTGDKAIDAAAPKGQPAKKVENVVAKKPAKKSKFSGMGMASLSKLNFMNKKKQPAPSQTATKDAPKQL